MKRSLALLIISTSFLAQIAYAEPIIVVRPQFGSGTAGVLPQSAFAPNPTAPSEMVISAPQIMTFEQGVPGSLNLIKVTGAVGALSFRLLGTLPEGFSMDPHNGRISGTGKNAGTHGIQIEVTDETGRSAVSSLITLRIMEILDPIEITVPDLHFKVGENTFRQIPVSNAGTSIAFYIINGSLPPGITLDTDTGAIVGAPTNVGNWTALIAVTDETLRVSTKPFDFTVTN